MNESRENIYFMVCKNVKRTWTKAHVPVGVSVLTQRHTQEVEKETHRCSVSMGLVETTIGSFLCGLTAFLSGLSSDSNTKFSSNCLP